MANNQQLTQEFFEEHPLLEFSLPLYLYNLYTDAGLNQRDQGYYDLTDILTDEQEADKKAISECEPEELIRWMRKKIPGSLRNVLQSRLIENESVVRDAIYDKAFTNLQEIFIENAARFMLFAKEDPSQWISTHYADIQSPYMQGMLCLVLTLRSDDPSARVEFLKAEADRLQSEYPDSDYAQGPLVALSHIMSLDE